MALAACGDLIFMPFTTQIDYRKAWHMRSVDGRGARDRRERGRQVRDESD